MLHKCYSLWEFSTLKNHFLPLLFLIFCCWASITMFCLMPSSEADTRRRAVRTYYGFNRFSFFLASSVSGKPFHFATLHVLYSQSDILLKCSSTCSRAVRAIFYQQNRISRIISCVWVFCVLCCCYCCTCNTLEHINDVFLLLTAVVLVLWKADNIHCTTSFGLPLFLPHKVDSCKYGFDRMNVIKQTIVRKIRVFRAFSSTVEHNRTHKRRHGVRNRMLK